MDEKTKSNIENLWNYLCLKNEPIKSECIMGLGSILDTVPKQCAELYHKGYGEYIIFTGNCGKGTEGIINKTEAEIFKRIAMEAGVPEEKILIETEATNTYENFNYSLKVLAGIGLSPKSFLIVGKPYQERRALNIAEISLANNTFSIAPNNISFSEFLEYVTKNSLMSLEDVINELVSEINICLLAPKYGIQKKSDISTEVLKSYRELCNAGYTKYLITDDKINKILAKWQEEANINKK